LNLRRFVFALVITAAAVSLLVWHNRKDGQADQAPQEPAAVEKAETPAEATSQPAADETPPAGEAPSEAPADSPQDPAARPDSGTVDTEWFVAGASQLQKSIFGSLIDAEDGYTLQLELVNEGAAVDTIKLAKYFATNADKRLHHDDPAAYAQARLKNPGKYQGHYALVRTVGPEGTPRRPFATRTLVIADATPEGKLLGKWNLAQFRWRRVASSAETNDEAGRQVAAFEWVLHHGTSADAAKPFVRVRKTYTVRRQDYSIEVSLAVENLSGRALRIGIDQAGPTGLPREDIRSDLRKVAYGRLESADGNVQVQLKPVSEADKGKLGQVVSLGGSDGAEPPLWVGQTNKYFGSMMYLRPDAGSGRLAAPQWQAQFYAEPTDSADQGGRTFLTGIRLGFYDPDNPLIEFSPGQVRTATFDVFAGPKKREMFSNPDATFYRPLYEKLDYLSTIDFGGCFCSWAPLSLGMMWLLQTLSKLALGNYGVAIILLVVLVRIVLHPLTKKGQVSMARMQKFAPQMQKLKEKYADDKDTLNREMMKFYKQQGATPLLGCLPMMLQMPIWVALWTGLNASVELRHAAFLPVWITDLAGPDALFSWIKPISIPLIGAVTSFNLLPILLMVAMFLQAKLNPQMSGQAASPDQAKQQKLMSYMMPAMMLLFFYNAPSGLTLYIMTSTFAGVAEQYVIRKHIRDKEAAEAAVETTVVVPGKAARSARPKKPKGPTWVKRG